ncbi:lipopolysaccharide transport periplasmic protein LptA [Leeia sp. TBRC 13508]|uniref:Lipopolysaccharide export system protein LptA n=1 Tax=Leeia speluncae TaxID=2884804 RepID=A0ABS8D656_9NEIS|nr:lipopolysaccharide transport periplasmic protein LptA [Leeia speluncae]MCB6183691.1 lipopolysaccharide transport periplasmic protein LptA [Leeia speluncae]
MKQSSVLAVLRPLSVLAVLIMSCNAYAEQADRDKPINIEADQGMSDMANSTSRYEGNVIITQGTLRLRADRIDVQSDKAGKMLAQAYGKPVTFRQKQDQVDEYIEAQASRIDYDSGKNQLKLTGDARVKRGGDELRGAVIFYDAVSQQYSVQGSPATGGKSGGRVHAVIQPKTATTNDAAKPSTTP